MKKEKKTSYFIENFEERLASILILAMFIISVLGISSVISAKLSLNEYDMSDVLLTDSSIEYDGTVHSLEIVGDLPDGVSVSYTYDGDSVDGETNVGSYEVVASFTGDSSYAEIDDMSATLTITQASLTSEDITFTNTEVAYTGSLQSVGIEEELPDGVSVSYTYDGDDVEGETLPGTYDVVATFTDEFGNYATTKLTTTFTISGLTLDTDNITFTDTEVEYDGTVQSVGIEEELPDGVSVSYTYDGDDLEGETNPGEYNVVATFTDSNGIYNQTIKTTTLTINYTSSYDFTVSNGEATITGYTVEDVYSDITIPEKVADADGEYTVVALSSYAFTGYSTATSSVETIEMADTITSIGSSCFAICISLVSIDLSSSLESIGEGAFSSCYDLESITIPASVTSISKNAFSSCRSLINAIFEDQNNWYVSTSEGSTDTEISNLSDETANSTYLTDTYKTYYWTKVSV